MPGVALLYIAFNAINLEPPSEASRTKADDKIRDSLKPSEHELTALNGASKVDALKLDMVKKRKGARGPNPLSCKKKKKPENTETGPVIDCARSAKKKKRQRRRSHKCLAVGNSTVVT